MAKTKQNPTTIKVLLVLMVIIGILLFRQYMPKVSLPTDGAIEEEMLRLDSRLKDLENARMVRREFGNELQRLRAKSSGLWVRKRPGNAVEQEVLDEFNNIVRLAGINIQSREAKLNKVVNSMYVNEVEVHADIRGVSMKEFMRFLKEVEANPRRFHWSSCKIDPDNVNKPTGIRATCRLKAYILSEDATRLLSSEASPVEKAVEAPASKAPASKGAASRASASKVSASGASASKAPGSRGSSKGTNQRQSGSGTREGVGGRLASMAEKAAERKASPDLEQKKKRSMK